MPIIFTPGPLVQRSQFYQQLGQLLGAGLPVLKALDLLHRKPPGLSYREPIQRLIEQISQGGTVTDAMRSLGKWTPQFDLALIHAGETSGRLDIVFRLLSDHYAERAALARQMIV